MYFVLNFISNCECMIDKITNRIKFQFLAFIILSTSFARAQAQQAAELVVVSKFRIYKEQVTVDPSKKMVELKTIAPKLVYDLRYATDSNFLHQRLYKSGHET